MKEFIFTLLKFLLAVLLMPVVIASFVGFLNHLQTYPTSYAEFFRWGILGFLITFLFLYQFWGVYEMGQDMMHVLFVWLTPFNKLVARLVPFYLTIILLLFYVTKKLLGVDQVSHYY